jgi:hypothetical protein
VLAPGRRSPLLFALTLALLPLQGFAVTADALSVLFVGRDGHVDVESRAGHHAPVRFAVPGAPAEARATALVMSRTAAAPCVDGQPRVDRRRG